MKKMVTLLLALSMLSVAPVTGLAASPDFELTSNTSSDHNGIEPRVSGSGIAYREIKESETLVKKRTFIAWHPAFNRYEYNVSGYAFTNTNANASLNVSVNISSTIYSVGISYQKAGQVGSKLYKADPNKMSRPAIYGDTYLETYKAGYYDFNRKQWSQTPKTIQRGKVKNTCIVIEYE